MVALLLFAGLLQPSGLRGGRHHVQLVVPAVGGAVPAQRRLPDPRISPLHRAADQRFVQTVPGMHTH
jgi:hypothetical protein